MKTQKPPMSRAAMAARLRSIQEAYANPRTFKVGDIVVLNPLFLPPNYTEDATANGVFMPLVVLEVVDDFAAHDPTMSAAEAYHTQGFRSADIRLDDTIAFAWCPSWMYVPAETKLITDEPVGTSH